jgi:hypothetical protein
MPGCTRTRNLHAHHVIYWSHGGATDLANLVLVCSRHHTLLHTEGFQLTLRADRSLDVRTADNVRILHHPARQASHPDELPAATFTPSDGSRLDLDHAVWVLRQQAA